MTSPSDSFSDSSGSLDSHESSNSNSNSGRYFFRLFLSSKWLFSAWTASARMAGELLDTRRSWSGFPVGTFSYMVKSFLIRAWPILELLCSPPDCILSALCSLADGIRVGAGISWSGTGEVFLSIVSKISCFALSNASFLVPVICRSLSFAPGTTLWKLMMVSEISSIIFTRLPFIPITFPESEFRMTNSSFIRLFLVFAVELKPTDDAWAAATFAADVLVDLSMDFFGVCPADDSDGDSDDESLRWGWSRFRKSA